MIKITGLDKAEVLAALFNNANPMWPGIIQTVPCNEMTIAEARDILQTTTNFDYLIGRVLKIDLSNDDEFDEQFYDMGNGEGTAQRAIDSIMKNKDIICSDQHSVAIGPDAKIIPINICNNPDIIPEEKGCENPNRNVSLDSSK